MRAEGSGSFFKAPLPKSRLANVLGYCVVRRTEPLANGLSGRGSTENCILGFLYSTACRNSILWVELLSVGRGMHVHSPVTNSSAQLTRRFICT